MKSNKTTRRKFVTGTAGLALGTMIVPRHVLGGTGYKAPSDRLNVAVIGCGGQGASDATELVQGGENIVALADVDFNFVEKAMAERLQRALNPRPPNPPAELRERAHVCCSASGCRIQSSCEPTAWPEPHRESQYRSDSKSNG